MRGPRAAWGRRAVASMATSLSLHLVVGAGATSVLLGGTLGALWPDADPPTVEIIVVEGRDRQAVPAPPRVARQAVSRTLRSARTSTPAPAEPSAEPPETTVPPSAAGLDTAPREGESTAREPAAPAASALVEDASDAEPVAASEVRAAHVAVPADERGTARSDDGAPTTGLAAANAALQTGFPAPHVSQARVDEVTRNPSLSAQAESEAMVGRREVFEFLLDHPDFATHITRALRLARYRIWRTDEGMFVDDGWGATGQITVVHAGGGTRMLYAKGEFQHKLLPTIPGEAVVTIEYEARPAGDGRQLLQARLSGQLKIDSAFGTLMLKIASSVAREKAAKESRRLLQTFANVLRAIDETPGAVYASVSARPDVPRTELEQFRVLLGLP